MEIVLNNFDICTEIVNNIDNIEVLANLSMTNKFMYELTKDELETEKEHQLEYIKSKIESNMKELQCDIEYTYQNPWEFAYTTRDIETRMEYVIQLIRSNQELLRSKKYKLKIQLIKDEWMDYSYEVYENSMTCYDEGY